MSHHKLLAQMMAHDGGGFSPSDIATIHHWLHGSDLTTMWEDDARTTPASDTSVVGSWEDKISGAFFTQPTAASKPIVDVSSGGLVFDGADDYLGAPKSVMAWAEVAGVNTCVFAIVSMDSAASAAHIFGPSFNFPGMALRTASTKLEVFCGDGTSSFATLKSTALISNGLQLSELSFDNTNDLLSPIINNGVKTDTVAATFDFGIAPADTIVTVGAAAGTFSSPQVPFNGPVLEIVVTEEITAEERTNLMTYFNDEYGMSLPTTG